MVGGGWDGRADDDDDDDDDHASQCRLCSSGRGDEDLQVERKRACVTG